MRVVSLSQRPRMRRRRRSAQQRATHLEMKKDWSSYFSPSLAPLSVSFCALKRNHASQLRHNSEFCLAAKHLPSQKKKKYHHFAAPPPALFTPCPQPTNCHLTTILPSPVNMNSEWESRPSREVASALFWLPACLCLELYTSQSSAGGGEGKRWTVSRRWSQINHHCTNLHTETQEVPEEEKNGSDLQCDWSWFVTFLSLLVFKCKREMHLPIQWPVHEILLVVVVVSALSKLMSIWVCPSIRVVSSSPPLFGSFDSIIGRNSISFN